MPPHPCVTRHTLSNFGAGGYPDWRLRELEAEGKFPKRVEVRPGEFRWDPDALTAWADRRREGGRHAPPA